MALVENRMFDAASRCIAEVESKPAVALYWPYRRLFARHETILNAIHCNLMRIHALGARSNVFCNFSVL